MYSGLLPKGLTESDLSPDEEDETLNPENGSVVREPVEERDSPPAHNEQNAESQTDCLPGVSLDMWRKFKEIQKKKDDLQMIKTPRRRRRKLHKKGTKSKDPPKESNCQEELEQPWDGLKQYFGANDRFEPPACSKPPPKSGLEKSIENSIAEGDIEKAEEMSDRLATRELAVKIARAADCRDFVQGKQEEEALRVAHKRKKNIPWGFEAKKRWETKSNMGFM